MIFNKTKQIDLGQREMVLRAIAEQLMYDFMKYTQDDPEQSFTLEEIYQSSFAILKEKGYTEEEIVDAMAEAMDKAITKEMAF